MGCRGDERKGIVKVRHLRSLRADKGSELSVCRCIPDGGLGKLRPTHIGYRIIVHNVTKHPMAVRFQQRALSFEYLVFAAGLLVVVVQEEYFHGVVGQPASL